MLAPSARIGIALIFMAGAAILAEAIWQVARGRRRLPIKRTLTISLAAAIAGGAEIVYADHLTSHPTWQYTANVAGILLVLAGATYAGAMCRSQALPREPTETNHKQDLDTTLRSQDTDGGLTTR